MGEAKAALRGALRFLDGRFVLGVNSGMPSLLVFFLVFVGSQFN